MQRIYTFWESRCCWFGDEGWLFVSWRGELLLWNSMEFREFSSLIYQIYYILHLDRMRCNNNGFYLSYTLFIVFLSVNIMEGWQDLNSVETEGGMMKCSFLEMTKCLIYLSCAYGFRRIVILFINTVILKFNQRNTTILWFITKHFVRSCFNPDYREIKPIVFIDHHTSHTTTELFIKFLGIGVNRRFDRHQFLTILWGRSTTMDNQEEESRRLSKTSWR